MAEFAADLHEVTMGKGHRAVSPPSGADKPKTAAKALRRAGTVLEWAVAASLRTGNPARAIARAAATLEARALAPVGIAAAVLTPEGGDFNDDLAALGPQAPAV